MMINIKFIIIAIIIALVMILVFVFANHKVQSLTAGIIVECQQHTTSAVDAMLECEVLGTGRQKYLINNGVDNDNIDIVTSGGDSIPDVVTLDEAFWSDSGCVGMHNILEVNMNTYTDMFSGSFEINRATVIMKINNNDCPGYSEGQTVLNIKRLLSTVRPPYPTNVTSIGPTECDQPGAWVDIDTQVTYSPIAGSNLQKAETVKMSWEGKVYDLIFKHGEAKRLFDVDRHDDCGTQDAFCHKSFDSRGFAVKLFNEMEKKVNNVEVVVVCKSPSNQDKDKFKYCGDNDNGYERWVDSFHVPDKAKNWRIESYRDPDGCPDEDPNLERHDVKMSKERCWVFNTLAEVGLCH